MKPTSPRRKTTAAAGGRQAAGRAVALSRLTVEEAILALLIAAMDANGHVSAEEAARAHNLIWSMRRFRRKSGEVVGRGIDRMRALVEQRGAEAVLQAGARRIPRDLHMAVFAVAADLVLADAKLEPSERRFLDRLAEDLGIDARLARRIRDVMLVKNRL